jgi:hypothetical protein
MLRVAALATILAALALPAAAQQATPSGGIDWSKPVVGVDGNIPQARAEDAPLPVEVFTVEDLKANDSPSVKELIDALRKPAERCDPAKVGVTVQCTYSDPKDAPPPKPPSPGN